MKTKDIKQQYVEDTHTDFENLRRGCWFVFWILVVSFCCIIFTVYLAGYL